MLLGTSPNDEDSNDTSSINTNKIQIDDIQKLLANALKNEGFTDILLRVFPSLSSEEAAKIEENTTKLFEEKASQLKVEQDKNSYFFQKLSFAITMTVLGTYFGGPIAATCSSGLFTKAYTIIFGVPNSNSLLYGMFFSPCKQFLTSISKQYGSYVVGAFAASTSYSAASAIEFLANRISQLKELVYERKKDKKSDSNISIQTAEEIFQEFELMNLTDRPEELDIIDEDGFTMILPRYDSLKKSKKEAEKQPEIIEVCENASEKQSRLPFTSYV
jgi:hypothetical protein